MNNSVWKFFRLATGKQDGKFFNRLANRQFFGNDHHSWQEPIGFEPLIAVPGHRIYIMRYDYSIVCCSPIQDPGVILLRDLCLLHKSR